MFWNRDNKNDPKTALILSGGGARAAYQVGVLKAFADILPKETGNPFPIICGTSAGAINAAALAIYSAQFREAISRLVYVWGNFHVHHVFSASFGGLSKSFSHWMLALMAGGMGKFNPSALLDRSPLEKLLDHYLPFERVQDAIDAGRIHALSLTASSYSTGHSVAFFQGHESIDAWERTRRLGRRTELNIHHLMASSAIPIVFGPEEIDGEFYGDGTMRQTAPLSSALHLGADKILVIGVKHAETQTNANTRYQQPSLGEITGNVLDSIFLDNIDMDVERLQRINRTMESIPDRHRPDQTDTTLRQVDILSISPSQDLFRIAQKHAALMPLSMRFFLRGLGVSKQRGSNLLSYLLFEKAYCRDLIALGYGDAMARRAEILKFFDLKPGEHMRFDPESHNA